MSADAELAIIGRAMDSAESYDRVSLKLGVGDFMDDRCRLLWELISKLREAGREPDAVSVAAMLGRSARWAALDGGDPLAFTQYAQFATPSGHLLDQYIGLVEDASAGRRLRAFAETASRLAANEELSADEKLAAMQAAMPKNEPDEGVTITYGKAARLAIEDMRRRTNGEIQGMRSELADLDDLIGGFEPGTLTLVAGRPSHGKSIIAMQLAEAAAAHGPVFVFSIEMTAMNLAQRAISARASTDFGDMRGARIDERMDMAMSEAVVEMDDLPIVIDERTGYSVDQLRARVRMMARRTKPAMIVLDYLTLVSGVGDNRTAQVGYVSRSLKAMAKEIGVPVVTVAQLNRGVDSRPDKRPTSSDLRDSGEVEQDADVIVCTYLHEKYDPETPRAGIGELIVVKNRNGRTGNVFVGWEGRYQRFVNHAGEVPPEKAPKEGESGDFQPRAVATKKGYAI